MGKERLPEIVREVMTRIIFGTWMSLVFFSKHCLIEALGRKVKNVKEVKRASRE